jgi:hypothetical protein
MLGVRYAGMLLAGAVTADEFQFRDWWLVVLKTYFDGAQTADADRVTLASVSGTCDEWSPVERAWKQVIADHKAPPLHTTNAYALQKEFKGWTNEKVNAYISACVDVLKHSFAQPGKILVPTASGYLPNIVKTGLNGVTMTIPFDDFRRARDEVESFPNTISELCASETLGFVLRYGKRLGVVDFNSTLIEMSRFAGMLETDGRAGNPGSRFLKLKS